MERRKLVTEDTVINIDETVFKLKAEELMCEMFIGFVNDKFNSPVLEIKL